MRAVPIPVDTEAFGRPVVALHEVDPSRDWAGFEAAELQPLHPWYVYARIPVEDLRAVHYLERAGFRFIETQLRLSFQLRPGVHPPGSPYRYERVTDPALLPEIQRIAAESIVHDRITVDPELGAVANAARYALYVERSFRAPDERLYRLADADGRTVAFRTQRRVSATEVLLLIGGVRRDLDGQGLGPLISLHDFQTLYAEGVRRGTTHISAANRPVFQLEVSRLGFRLAATFVVLRKLYP